LSIITGVGLRPLGEALDAVDAGVGADAEQAGRRILVAELPKLHRVAGLGHVPHRHPERRGLGRVARLVVVQQQVPVEVRRVDLHHVYALTRVLALARGDEPDLRRIGRVPHVDDVYAAPVRAVRRPRVQVGKALEVADVRDPVLELGQPQLGHKIDVLPRRRQMTG
jgi:hypothetical protein